MRNKTKKIISKRNPPINISEKDTNLFKHEYKKLIPPSRVKKKYNVYISNFQLKKFKHFRYLIKQWRMNPVTNKEKMNFLLRDFYSFFTSKKKSEIIVISKSSWVIDSRSHQYFHWFTDAMQRIQTLGSLHEEYPILLTSNFNGVEYIKKSLNLLNINFIELEENKEYLIEQLIMAERVSPAGNYNKDIVRSISNKFKKTITSNKNNINYEKIWISRQSALKRKVLNFDEIEPILLENKFMVLEYEKLDLEMQINISNRCKVLGGVHGAGLTNMMFMDKHSSVLEIRAENDNKNNCFFTLASDLDLNYYYFLGESENEDFYGSDYRIDKDKFNNFLRSNF